MDIEQSFLVQLQQAAEDARQARVKAFLQWQVASAQAELFLKAVEDEEKRQSTRPHNQA